MSMAGQLMRETLTPHSGREEMSWAATKAAPAATRAMEYFILMEVMRLIDRRLIDYAREMEMLGGRASESR